jgi:cation diffusion facilitator family transporter
MKTDKRHRIIVRAGIIGIVFNLILAALKVVAGLFAGSIAIIADAANSLSDCLSSIVTIIVSYLAKRAPDKEHPLGHGRSEYMGTLVVGGIIGYIGITAGVEAVKKIIAPTDPEYSFATLIVVICAILTKIFLSVYTLAAGKKANSDTLIASGKDAFSDVLISSSTLLAIAAYHFFGLNIEPYLALLISLLIIRTGYGILRETTSQILGERAEHGLTKRIRNTINTIEPVEGAYDLILNDYGPTTTIASVNIELPCTMTAHEIDDLSREIRRKVYKKHQIIISSVGIYSINTKDSETRNLYHQMQNLLENYPDVIELHGFHYDKADKTISCDIVIDFAIEDRQALFAEIRKAAEEAFSGYKLEIVLDADLVD